MKVITLFVPAEDNPLKVVADLDKQTNEFAQSHRVLSVGSNDKLSFGTHYAPIIARTIIYDDYDDENP